MPPSAKQSNVFETLTISFLCVYILCLYLRRSMMQKATMLCKSEHVTITITITITIIITTISIRFLSQSGRPSAWWQLLPMINTSPLPSSPSERPRWQITRWRWKDDNFNKGNKDKNWKRWQITRCWKFYKDKNGVQKNDWTLRQYVNIM